MTDNPIYQAAYKATYMSTYTHLVREGIREHIAVVFARDQAEAAGQLAVKEHQKEAHP